MFFICVRIQPQNGNCSVCLLFNLPFSGDVTLDNSLDCRLQSNTVEADYRPLLDNKAMNECRNHTEDHNDEYLQDLVHKLTTNTKHLKIAHLNVRGLRKKVDELRILLKLCRFDVFGVTETHLNSEIIDGEIDIEDYNLIRRDRLGRQGGGCVIYYSKSLKAIHRPDLEDEQVEGICMQVKADSRDILVGTTNLLQDERGDTSYEGNKMKGILEQFNMKNVVKGPTRITNHSKTLIDLIVTNRKDLVKQKGTCPLGISDHDMIYATSSASIPRPA